MMTLRFVLIVMAILAIAWLLGMGLSLRPGLKQRRRKR